MLCVPHDASFARWSSVPTLFRKNSRSSSRAWIYSKLLVRDAYYILVLSRRFLASAQFSAEMLCVAPGFML